MSDPIETIESEVERLTGSGVVPMQETLTIRDALAAIQSSGFENHTLYMRDGTTLPIASTRSTAKQIIRRIRSGDYNRMQLALADAKLAGRGIFADEVGSEDWQAAKAGGSKVDLVRTRLEAGEAK